MKKSCFSLEGRRIWLYAAETPRVLFLHPADAREGALEDRLAEEMAGCALPFALAAFEIRDWNRELSPWEAPPVFGKAPFGGGGPETLDFVTERLLPALEEALDRERDLPLCLGGYSLGGLFALWAATQTARFSAVAAASPSVWFPGWIDWAREHLLLAPRVYLSLGDREERAKNPVMARVGDCIREQAALLEPEHDAVLEWNEGNHFRDVEKRTARAFCWCAARMAERA